MGLKTEKENSSYRSPLRQAAAITGSGGQQARSHQDNRQSAAIQQKLIGCIDSHPQTLSQHREPPSQLHGIKQLTRKLDHGAGISSKMYAKEIAATGTDTAIKAVAISMSEGSGVYLTDTVLESQHGTRFGGSSDIRKIVFPDIDAIKQDQSGYPDILKNNGLSIEQNCAMVAEHELIHLKHASENLSKGGSGAGTDVEDFDDSNITTTVEGLIDTAGSLSTMKSSMSLTRLENAKVFVVKRLRYILRDYQKNHRNSEAPAVIRELRRYLESIVKSSDSSEWLDFKSEIALLDDKCSSSVGILQESGSKCFLTTACTKFMGLKDNCDELRVLRDFRDNYLLKQDGGETLVMVYYQSAPVILHAIRRREDEEEILRRIYKIICGCVDAISSGDFESGFQLYSQMMLDLARELTPELSAELALVFSEHDWCSN